MAQQMRVNDLVRVVGLTNQTQHNGKTALVEKVCDDGKVELRLFSGAGLKLNRDKVEPEEGERKDQALSHLHAMQNDLDALKVRRARERGCLWPKFSGDHDLVPGKHNRIGGGSGGQSPRRPHQPHHGGGSGEIDEKMPPWCWIRLVV